MAKTEIIISAQDKTKQAFDSVRGSLNGLTSYAGNLTSLMGGLGGLGSIIGTTSFAAFTKSGIDTLDMLGDLSDRTGVAASTLSGFQLVAAQSDTSLEALGKGINKLSIFMAENAEQAKKLGLSAKEPAEAFIQLSDLLSGIEDDQKRAAVASKILGKSYQELLPALIQGGDALRKQIDAGKEYAGVNEEMVKQAQQFNDQMDLLKVQVSNAGIAVASDLLPSLNETITEMKRMRDEGNSLMAVLRGLAGLGKVPFDFFFPDKPFTTTDHIKDMRTELEGLKKDAFNAKGGGLLDQWLAGGSEGEIQQKIKVLENQISDYDKFKDKLEKPVVIPEPVAQKKNNGFVDSFINPNKSAKKSGKSETEKNAEEAARFVESLQKQIETLDLSKSSLLAYDATHLKLNASQKQTVNGLIDVIATREQLAKDNEAWAEQEKLNAQFDDEQLRQLEEVSSAEAAAAEARSQAYAEMTASILQDNEDLNISLITSDKKRIRAQVDLEHARAMERIESMVGEADEVQAAIDAETEHYRLKLKEVDQSLNKTKSVSQELGATFKSAFEDSIVNGDKFSDVLQGLEQDIVRLAARKTILDPLLKAFDTLLTSTPSSSGGGNFITDFIGGIFKKNANGGVYDSPSLSKYSGGVYNSPQAFAFANGAGIFAEAGPEAIMPLSRGADGKLGVKSSGTGGMNVVVNLIESPGNGGQVNQKQEGENLTLEIMVEKISGMMSRDISKGRGISGTLERQYGLSRAAGAM